MSDEWIHIDPCEAAVDEPLIYKGWGKNQTFIFAFQRHQNYIRREEVDERKSRLDIEESYNENMIPMGYNVSVEDVTLRYTSDNVSTVEERRMMEGVHNQSRVLNEISRLYTLSD